MTRLGKYEILEEIGRGGFAVVYKARDTTLDRLVALKVLHPQLTVDPKFVQRFQQEARTAASFQHPHIVTIYEVGEEAGQHYLAMALLPGRTLDRQLAEGLLPVEQAVSIVEQIARALDAIHQRGFVHRDVKPGNVMLDASGQATLLDFGIVRAAEGTRLTTSMAVLGTPEYMSPEQAEGEEPDARSDIYSLGVVAYQVFTGQAPFSAPSPLAVLRFHADKPPTRPRELNPALSAEIEQVLLKALAKRREDRYQSAGEMARALRGAVEAEGKIPLPAPRPAVRESRSRPGLQPAKPIPWRWIAAAGLLVSALIVIVLVLTGGRGEDAEPTDTPTAAAVAVFTPTNTRAPRPTPTVEESTNTPTVPPSPARTRTPRPSDTPRPSVTPGSILDVDSTVVRERDFAVMVYVPGGTFQMGSTEGDPDERPVHSVTLNSFWIDKYEITNLRFNGCVKDGVCGVPGCWDNSEVSVPGQPVMCVNWHNAKAYCEWAGARLPTEAEWEYAARGPQGNRYPWGDTFDGERLNFCDASCTQDWKDTRWDDGYAVTALAGSFEAGASWCKALDLAGNLFEWVNDWYQADYYAVSPASNPPGPGVGDTKVARGGAWYGGPNFMRSADRLSLTPDNGYYDGGFRCAASSTP